MENEWKATSLDHNDLIRRMTPGSINAKIDRQTWGDIALLEGASPELLRRRLKELDKEWDIDRALMVNFSVLVFAQLVLAMRRGKKWLWGPLVQTPLLFLHANIGWCPPVLWFRPLGFRTRKEIEAERAALENLLEKKAV